MAKIEVELRVPMTPNFIKAEDGSQHHISKLDDKILKAIGREWTKNLIKTAHAKR